MASTREQKDVSRKSFVQWKAKNMANGPRHRGYPDRKGPEKRHQSETINTYKR